MLHEHSCTPCSASRNITLALHWQNLFHPIPVQQSCVSQTIKARGGLTQRGFTCIVDPSLRKSQLEDGQLCAAAAQSTSSCLAASAGEMSQGHLQRSCWVSLCSHTVPRAGTKSISGLEELILTQG